MTTPQASAYIPKDVALYLHTRNRMRSRYGRDLSFEEYKALGEDVANRAKQGKKQTCRKFVTHATIINGG